MGLIRERFAKLSVRTISDDESVIATMKQSGGIRVAIKPGMAERHTERSLEASIEQVLARAIAGYAKGAEAIRSEARGGREAADPQTPIGKRRADYLDRLAAIEATAESPRGFVVIDWNGADDISITLDGSPHSRLSEEAMSAEVNAAIVEVIRLRNVHILQIHQAVYRFDRFAKQGA